MKTLATIMILVAAFLFTGNPAQAKVVKKVKKHHVVHKKTVHHKAVATSVDAATANSVAANNSAPKTLPAKAVSHVRTAAHKVSYSTWKLTHPNQARAEYDAEQAADAKREAADRAHEAEYKKTHP